MRARIAFRKKNVPLALRLTFLRPIPIPVTGLEAATGSNRRQQHNDQGTRKTTTPPLLVPVASGASPLLPQLRLGVLLLGHRRCWWDGRRRRRSSSSSSRREWRPSFTAQLGLVLRPRRTCLCTYDMHCIGVVGMHAICTAAGRRERRRRGLETRCPSPPPPVSTPEACSSSLTSHPHSPKHNSTTTKSTAGDNGTTPPRTPLLRPLLPPPFPMPLYQVPTEREEGRATPAVAAAAARAVDGTRHKISMGRCIMLIRIRA